MTKPEIIEAINSTIVPNGQKGITAESLNNILNEMANATYGGGGDGLLKVYVPDEVFGEAFVELEGFNLDNWNLIKAEFESESESGSEIGAEMAANIINNYDRVIKKYLYENSLAYQTILEKMRNREGIAVLGDMSESYAVTAALFFGALGLPVPSSGVDVSAGCVMLATVVDTGQIFMGEPIEIVLTFLANSVSGEDTLFDYYYLHEDGSLTFELKSTLGHRDFYVPLEGAALTSSQKETNISTAMKIKSSDFNIYGLDICSVSTDGEITINSTGGFGFRHLYGDTCSFLAYIGGVLKNVQINETTGEVSLYNVTE
jgi:hypothetical protein